MMCGCTRTRERSRPAFSSACSLKGRVENGAPRSLDSHRVSQSLWQTGDFSPESAPNSGGSYRKEVRDVTCRLLATDTFSRYEKNFRRAKLPSVAIVELISFFRAPDGCCDQWEGLVYFVRQICSFLINRVRY